jgi:hypothetical protein
MRHHVRFGILMALLAFLPAHLRAQAVSSIVSFGLADPSGGLGEFRNTGPVARAGVVLGHPRRVSQWRVEMEYARMTGREQSPSLASRDADITSLGLFGTITIGPRTPRWAPYFAIGAGLQRLNTVGVRNPYGTTPGVRTGFGLTGRHHTRHVFLEVLVHANLTDHGAGDYAIGYFFPVVAGVRF